MLSVILYGRNDSHGYNLHKRAAISLNAIAHLLSDAADEIIFVDYNTPDDLPTFPEAIADTLTDKAVEKLRILRVRPSVHNARFAAKTHLNALEPIARNVAIRRSNPANRWLLSTNTDMIFVPRRSGADLTTAIGALDDGFYHLPRFELPEGLWETMDRRDPAGLIEGAREWGERFFLNEIIVSGGDNLYDGPGDFQLFLRDDLFQIGGFHEEMIRGWHLDANIARRMRMLRGKVSTALDALVGYHCDHTRQSTAYHKADRIENSAAIFVDNVFEPQVRDQSDSWGLPELQIEELRLGHASGARYLAGLQSAVHGRLEGFLQAEYAPDAYGRLGYEPSHVLPYLLDLVSCIARETKIAYVGARRDTFAMFAKAWRAMGGTSPVMTPDIAPWLGEGEGEGEVNLVPLDHWLAGAELFIFEVGAETAHDETSLSDEERTRLWAVEFAFKRAVAEDRARQVGGVEARRVLIVNGVHNFMEDQVFAAVSVTLTPFSSRVRHGYFVDPARARIEAAEPPDRAALAALGRISAFRPDEAARLRALTAELKAGADDKVWGAAARMAAEIEAVGQAGVAGMFAGVGRPNEQLLERLATLRPSRAVKAVSGLLHPSAGGAAASRLARAEDWDDPEWLQLAAWLDPDRDHAELRVRDLWIWERVSLARNLFAALPMRTRPKVLVLGALPEMLAFSLAGLDCEVDIADPRPLAEGVMQAADWRGEFQRDGWMSREPVRLVSDRAAAITGGFRYDAVIAAQNAPFADGRGPATAVLRQAVRLLKPGGHLGLGLSVQLLGEDRRLTPFTLPASLVDGGRFAEALRILVDLEPVGGVDMRMTPRTFDRLAPSANPAGGPPALVVGEPPDLETSAVFALRKGASADDGDWDALAEAIGGGAHAGPAARSAPAAPATESPAHGGRIFTLAEVSALGPVAGRRPQPRFGPIFERLDTAEGVTRTPSMIRIPAALGEEVAVTAELGELPAGGYEMQIEATVGAMADAGDAMGIGVVGCGRLLVEQAERASGPGLKRFVVAFDVDEATAAAPGGLRLALKGLGRADLDIHEVVLR